MKSSSLRAAEKPRNVKQKGSQPCGSGGWMRAGRAAARGLQNRWMAGGLEAASAVESGYRMLCRWPGRAASPPDAPAHPYLPSVTNSTHPADLGQQRQPDQQPLRGARVRAQRLHSQAQVLQEGLVLLGAAGAGAGAAAASA